jgi:hypothetical protein
MNEQREARVSRLEWQNAGTEGKKSGLGWIGKKKVPKAFK